jgi:hypothetical protein
MANWQKATCLAVLLNVGLAGTAPGAEFNMDVKTEGIHLGPVVSGPNLAAADLKGRVVLLEFWGIN